ncbi:hypothetical protein [Snodgrassella communis]|uniref:hypothetical protein n=1 Tax=Snodgrassella communis TaxID=2946699 RepID=UPI000C1E811E|nr:hypothetical protein [Snodgrassella communis]PIT07975.1 hypothetical protein BGI31_08290 [Snodgrassella communis]
MLAFLLRDEEMIEEPEDFEQKIYKKITDGDELSNDELREVISCFHVYEEIINSHRWFEDIRSIVLLNDKYYAIDWRRGLTKKQSISYKNQPYEVVKTVKVVVDWEPV